MCDTRDTETPGPPMTADEFTVRAQLHRAVDQICDAEPHARLDARARGFPSGGDGSGVGGDPTGSAALASRVAEVWLAKLRQLQQAIYHQADRALECWPKPPTGGETVAGVTVGSRTNAVEVCWLCGDPAPSGRDGNGHLLVHRVPVGHGTVALHATSCYVRLWRKAQTEHVSIGAYLTANNANGIAAGH